MAEKLIWPPEDVPDYYIDQVRMNLSLYTVTLEIGIQGIPDTPNSEQPPTRRLARIRMSPHHALIFAKLLLKNLDEYQAKAGRINIPDEVYKGLGIQPDDRSPR